MRYIEGKTSKGVYATQTKAIVNTSVKNLNLCNSVFGDSGSTLASVLSDIENSIKNSIAVNQQSLRTYLTIDTDRLTYAKFIKTSSNEVICEIINK